MLTIPAAVETLLKSKVMVGDNRPTAIVEFAGQPVITGELIDPANWTDWQQQGAADYNQSGGNCASNIEGTPLMVYYHQAVDTVKVAYGTNWPAILSGTEDFDFATALTITTIKSQAKCRVALVDDELLLAMKWYDSASEKWLLEFWRDATGIGSSFVYVSTIAAEWVGRMITEIKKLSSGVLVVIANYTNVPYGESIMSHYSNDNGATWTAGAISGYLYSRAFNSGIMEFDDGSFGVIVTLGSGSCSVYYWSNNGTTLNSVRVSNWEGVAEFNWIQYVTWTRVANMAYMYCYGDNNGDAILKIESLSITPALLADRNNWQLIKRISVAAGERHISFCDNYLVLSNDFNGKFVIAGCVGERVNIPIKSVTVDRSKGSASMATVAIDNNDGAYSPDSTGVWNKILWLNKTIEITMGYGAEQETVFTGMIDEIMETNYPAELSIVARDYSKRALDQQPQKTVEGVTYYALLFENKSPEEIFAELALMAGWLAENIHVEISGVTLASIQFGHESFADCFQRLCELVAWEWFCDEIGDIYFRAAVVPEATAVYEFIEGTDIFGISYRISDAELYRNIVVWASDENGLAVKASTIWSAADYNNLLPLRTLIINAADLTTTAAGCQAIADAEANAITPKVREVNFVAVGNPYLQIGDVIKVTESTTHASELYRILEISHQMDAEGSPVFATALRCYHYGPAA